MSLAAWLLASCAHTAGPAIPTSAAAAVAPELVVQQGPGSAVDELAVSPDRRLLATVSEDGIRLWDIATGRILRSFPPHTPGRLDGGTVRFSADSTLLFNAPDRLKGGRIFDVRTGARVAGTIPPADTPPVGHCRRPGMKCVMQYAPDRRSAVIATVPGDADKNFYDDPNALEMPRENVELRSEPDGRLIGRWVSSISEICDPPHGPEVLCTRSVAFSRDSRRVAIQLSDWQIAVSETRTPAQQRTVALPVRGPNGALDPHGGFGRVQSFIITPSGLAMIVGDELGDLEAVDVRSGASHAFWDVRDNPGQSGVALSPNGEWLVAGVGAHSELWDLTTGQPALNLRGACDAVFSADSRRLACVQAHRLTVWNVGSGAPVAVWTLPARYEAGYQLTYENKQATFSPDGKLLLVTLDSQPHRGSWTYRYAYLLDIAKNTGVRVGGTLDASVSFGVGGGGQHVSWLEVDGSVHRFDFATRTVTRIGTLPESAIAAAYGGLSGILDGALAGDGRYAVVMPEEAVNDVHVGFVVYDTSTLKPVGVPYHDVSKLLAFSPDGKGALFADQENSVTLVDIASGRVLHRYTGHLSRVEEAAYSSDGGTLLTEADDNTVRIWDAERERQLGVMFPGAGGPYDWLVTRSNGSFDGSPGGWGAMLWRFDGQTFDVAEPETFFNDFFSPGLLTDLIHRRETSGATLSTLDRRLPRVGVTLLSKRPYGRTIRVRVAVSEAPPDTTHAAGSGSRDLRLLHNGSLVRLWPGDVLQGRSRSAFETTVTLNAGPNVLQAYAFNADGVRSAQAEIDGISSVAKARRSSAYVLAIGVNRYANSDFSLRYAASDAGTFARELEFQEARLFGKGFVHAETLLDDRATKSGIRAALANLATRVQPEDVVYIYFAGHGVAYDDRYYLVPNDIGYMGPQSPIDAAGFDAILQHSISDLDLAQDVLPIDARKIVLVIDACESGEALGTTKIGPMNAKGLAQLAYDKGMYVLAASQGDQAALESSQYGHGLLTYALITQALHDRQAVAADSPDYLLLRQWLAYAQTRVPELQLALMNDAQRKGREIAVVPGEDRTIADAQDRTLQRPRVFYPPYADVDGFVVASFPRRAH